MSSPKYERLTNEFPSETPAIERLLDFIESSRRKDAFNSRFSVDRFWELAQPSSYVNLLKILQTLVDEQVLDEIYRIEFDSLGGITELESLEQVPEEIHDWRRDITVPVFPENIHLYYKLHRDHA
jgi:hypothetical protein